MNNKTIWLSAREITRKATADGRLIELGWETLAKAVNLTDHKSIQFIEMRKAFFSGAHFMLHSVLAMVDDDNDVTSNDMARMASVEAELARFDAEIRKEIK